MDVTKFSKELSGFESFLKATLNDPTQIPSPLLHNFWEELGYSLFGGGKRFRPLLCLLTARALKTSESDVYGLAAAVEMIHTYSLIHDDLPCLDNDDLRRGRATHHKKFGEDMALLAGDGLLTLAFFTLASAYSTHPNLSEIIKEVSKAAGIQGMVGGQVLDMNWDSSSKDEKLLTKIHELKTGALISVSVRMSAKVCNASSAQMKSLSSYGDLLGLAFQIADDIQDAKEGETNKNFTSLWGEEKTKSELKNISEAARNHLAAFGSEADSLRDLIRYNLERV